MKEYGGIKTEDGRRKTAYCKLWTENCGLKILSFLLILFLASCQDVKKPEKPTNLISKEKMVDILSDVYISNAARNVNNKLVKKLNIQLASLIYAKHEIDSLQFVESNAYYSADLKTYSNLLTKVQTKLNVLLKEKDSLYKIAKKKDSIKKATKNKLKPTLKKADSIQLIVPAESN